MQGLKVTREPEAISRSGLFLAYATGAFGLGMVAQAAFLVPLRARELGAGFDAIGLIVGTAAVVALVASVPSGALIDRLGPKRTYVLAAIATGLISLVYPFVTNYWFFLILQPALGLVRNLAWMASQGYISSVSSAKDRATLTGRFSLVTNAGQVAGPILAGFGAQLVGIQGALFVPAVYAFFFGLLGAFLPAVGAPDAGAASRPGSSFNAAGRLARLARVRVSLLLTFATLWITSVYATFLPVYLTGQGTSAGLAGAVVATSGTVAAVTSPTVGFLARRASPMAISGVSLGCSCVGLALIPHLTQGPWVFVAPVLVGTGVGITLPLFLAVITTEAPSEQRGVALGLRSVATQGAMTTAPLTVGPLVGGLGAGFGFLIAAAVAALIVLTAAVISGRSARPATWRF